MKYKPTETRRLVKSKDLNHHGTLFAGTMSSWIVESAFIQAATVTGRPQDIVCLKLHGLAFRQPVTMGDVLVFRAHIAHAGNSSLGIYVEVEHADKVVIDGFLTFVLVDSEGKPQSHGIVIDSDEKTQVLNSKYKLAVKSV